MAYGIEIFSNSGGIQLDTTLPIRDFVPVAVGTANNVGTTAVPVVPGEDLIFIRYSVDYGDLVLFQMKLNQSNYSNMIFYSVTNPTNLLDPTGFTVTTLDYIHCKPIETALAGSDTYGIQVFDDQSPQNIVYDSRKYTQPGAFSILKYDNAFSYTGDPSVDPPITTDIAKYVDISDSWLIGFYNNRRMITNQHSTYGTGIYFHGTLQSLFGGPTQYAKNFQSQIIGEKFL